MISASVSDTVISAMSVSYQEKTWIIPRNVKRRLTYVLKKFGVDVWKPTLNSGRSFNIYILLFHVLSDDWNLSKCSYLPLSSLDVTDHASHIKYSARGVFSWVTTLTRNTDLSSAVWSTSSTIWTLCSSTPPILSRSLVAVVSEERIVMLCYATYTIVSA